MEQSKSVTSNAVVYFAVSFKQLCVVTVSLPIFGLFVCFVTAYIFQQDQIHETHCKVYNVIPSISAITGISPQRYLWRICVALHIGPRIVIALVYNTYYLSRLPNIPVEHQAKYKRLLSICYWLNVIEIASLLGVTYVSNRENYPLHEKMFICFMICSLSHMLVVLRTFNILKPQLTENEKQSYDLKRFLFAASLVSTLGLLIFFVKHRFMCHVMAFSWFSFCEYIIACANMAFHFTVVLDFPTEEMMVVNGLPGRLPHCELRADSSCSKKIA
ncbi:post-GPI attachment to proteins factor 2-like [Neocloeon triangulifer]|uniref:post-GPI attachment to proteins factor 2-like n=1 Tax=Neocloeon triangulifer TaxID=2078957 RepID=UPI00286F8592|nr:post-GPI attachment to proteins factor 2-like [Neocloeon triangulifer]